MTTLTIKVIYSLSELKDMYREHFGLSKKEKVCKEDIAVWLASLVEADIQ